MKKFLYCLFLIAYCSLQLSAQQTLSSKEMIGITPALPINMELPEPVKKILEHKLVQIATQNGFGSVSGEIALTADVITTDKQMTGTVPAQHILNIEVSFYILNLAEGVVIDETAVNLRGIDKSEKRAFIQAINRINPRSPAIRNFMNQSRKKIIDYYTTRTPALLVKAQSLAERGEYDEALSVLSAIPEGIDEYPAVADQMIAFYTKRMEKNAAAALQQAKAKIAIHDYEGALNDLAQIDPGTSSFTAATQLIESIKKSINEEEKAALEQEMKELEAERIAQQKAKEDAVELEKLRIDAARKIGEAYTEAQAKESITSQIAKWFADKNK